jgi:hypothetical protein
VVCETELTFTSNVAVGSSTTGGTGSSQLKSPKDIAARAKKDLKKLLFID